MVPNIPHRAVTLLLGLSTLAAALPQSTPGGGFYKSKPCRLLDDAGLSEQLYFAEDEEYSQTITSYYAGDSWDFRPQCILKPRTTEEVALAIQTLNSNKVGKCWYVAVRGGGHSNFPASTTDSGVTIDLGRLDIIDLNDDGTVSVGAGNRWGNVYRYLEPQGLMVAGGRENTVGVAGLLLGGGYSWYSGEVGFAADNVAAYEVVLADGSVVKATSSENTDLFRALKGGGPNFGVVTKFELNTFPARDLFGGIMIYNYASDKHAVMQSFNNMVDGNSNGHPSDQGFLSASWTPGQPPMMAFIPANIDGDADSAMYTGLKNLTPLADMRARLPVTGIAAQIAGAYGRYQIWHTLTYHSTEDMGRKVLSSFEALVKDLEGQIEGNISLVYLMTPFPKLFSSHGTHNVLGLDKSHTDDSVVFCIQALLPDTQFRDLLREKIVAAGDDIEAYAKETGQDTPWRFLNYAGPHQNPIGTYGEENIRFLKETAKKYDPEEFFQHGVPGGWKLKNV